MDLYETLLFLHVLSAGLAVGALTALWALVLGSSMFTPGSAMRFGRTAGILVGVGMMGAIIFGIWLAIEVDGYQLWDGWILASLAIWAVSGWAGGQAGRRSKAIPWVGGRRASAFRRSTASACSSSSS